MPTEQDWQWIGEGLARCLNATAVAITEAAGEALSNGPVVIGAITDWLDVNGGAAALTVVRDVCATALEGRRR